MAKSYSVKIENDEVVSIEIDGVHYDSLDEISDPDDRDKILSLMVETPDEMDLDVPARKSVMPKIFLLVFFGVAFLMLAISAFSGVSAGRAMAREKNAPGRVVDMVVRVNQDGNEFYYPVVEFSLPDESRQTVQIAEGSWPPAYEKGQEVTVAYDPEQRPLTARIDSFSSDLLRWTVSIITGVLGLAFLAGGLLARWIFKSVPEDVNLE